MQKVDFLPRNTKKKVLVASSLVTQYYGDRTKNFSDETFNGVPCIGVLHGYVKELEGFSNSE